jgi:hypothetical protein
MGADLLVAHWWTTKPKDQIAWEALRASIGAATIEDLDEEGLYEEGEVDDLRQRLLAFIATAEATWGGDFVVRDLDVCEFGPVTVLLSGGMSYGDDPTDSFRDMTLVPSSMLEQAGFFS